MKNRLKLLRVERGWTQEQLGQALGVSRQAVNALETEKHDPSLDLDDIPGLGETRRYGPRLVLSEIREFHRCYEWR